MKGKDEDFLLWDYFVAHAIDARLEGPKEAAKRAGEYADAMLVEREKRFK